jgi:t-SNARE complex subunit (syntaxin)
MNAFKKILVFSVLAISMAAITSTASAAATSYETVQAAIDNTQAKVAEIIAAANNGADNEVLAEMVSDARQLQKDIANNVLDLKRNQASNVLKQARTAFKNSEVDVAKAALTDAANRYQEIEQLYVANH